MFLLRRIAPMLRPLMRRRAAGILFGTVATAGLLASRVRIRCAEAATGSVQLVLGAVIQEDDPQAAKGLTIVIVKPGSLAEKCGLQENDMILEVDGLEVKSLDGYKKALIRYVNRKKMFKIQRGTQTLNVQIEFQRLTH